VAVTTSGRAAGAGIDDDRIGASADRVVDRDEAGLRVDRAGHGLAVDPAIATGRRQREGAMGVVTSNCCSTPAGSITSTGRARTDGQNPARRCRDGKQALPTDADTHHLQMYDSARSQMSGP